MQTQGYIGGGDSGDFAQGQYLQQQGNGQGLPAPQERQHYHAESSIPNLPPSTRPSGKNTIVSEHKDEMDQDIVDYVETEGGDDIGHDMIGHEIHHDEEYVSPQDDDGNGPDQEMYNVAARITIGNEHGMNSYDEYADHDDDEDDIYGDPDAQDHGGHGHGGHGTVIQHQGQNYDPQYYDDDDDEDEFETMQ